MLCNKSIDSSSHDFPHCKASLRKGTPPAKTNCSCLDALSFNKYDKDLRQEYTISY